MAPLVGALVLLAALGVGAQEAEAPVDAATREQREADAKSKLEAIRESQRALQAEREATRGERSALVAALRALELDLATVARDLHRLDAELAKQRAALDALAAREHELEARLATQREAVAALARSAYALGRHSQLKLVFAPDEVATMSRLLAYHRVLHADRERRIAAIRADQRELVAVRAALAAARAGLDGLRGARATQGELQAAKRVEQQAALASLEQKFTDQGARLAALGKDEKDLVALLERLRDAIADIPKVIAGGEPFATRRGRLDWPVKGEVLTRFGAKTSDGRTSTGVLIAASAGADVRAAGHGRVAYADWLKGYGLVAIVDHGDGWLTLYAHNEALLKDVGDWVAPGEALATAGASGGAATPGVYFEIRRKGQPIDPAGWLAKR
ncbi:MAG TPA: peptidoglycan DD-metalloendopeptidase family protein [Xanthomonadales bacterium]|nr:peptidoglycan DD-metalloendopeptidase family protein [Xanthomonadales bacterium]